MVPGMTWVQVRWLFARLLGSPHLWLVDHSLDFFWEFVAPEDLLARKRNEEAECFMRSWYAPAAGQIYDRDRVKDLF